MEKTVNDFIAELQSLKPSLMELPVKIASKNGQLFEPVCKSLLNPNKTIWEDPDQMIITYN